MSSFIVQDKTINDVLGYLKYCKDVDWVKRTIKRRFGVDVEGDENLEQFGGKLYLMNVAAVDSRYNEKNDAVKILQDFKFKPTRDATRQQRLKSAQCLSYQCAEGDVPKTTLYKCLDFIIAQIAIDIAESTPEYKRAGWDFVGGEK